jgi:hypothetical protein
MPDRRHPGGRKPTGGETRCGDSSGCTPLYACGRLAVRYAYHHVFLQARLGLYTRQVWQLDFHVTCHEGRHATLVKALGIPGIVLFAAGWPVLVAILMSGLQPYLLCGRRFSLVKDMAGESAAAVGNHAWRMQAICTAAERAKLHLRNVG